LNTPDTEAARNIRLEIEYDGTAYCGWQWQKNGLSIQQVMEEAIGRITGEKVRISGSGRTDSGVHALCQVANFHTDSVLPERSLRLGLNSLLPPDIAVRSLQEVDHDFHARFSVKSKVYEYRICNCPVRPVRERLYTWFIWRPLDLEKMREVLTVFRGRHDFTSFCSTHTDSEDHVRTILAAAVDQTADGMLTVTIEADGFLRYMVRTIVGTLAYAGLGKCTRADVEAILESRDRRNAKLTAPPQGLFLKQVNY
jgi:tRNA pseudouridine38-40 synthase